MIIPYTLSKRAHSSTERGSHDAEADLCPSPSVLFSTPPTPYFLFPSYIALPTATFLKSGLPDSFSHSRSLPSPLLPVTLALILLPVYRHPPPFVLATPDAVGQCERCSVIPSRSLATHFQGRIKLNAHVGSLGSTVAWPRLSFSFS